MGTDLGALLQDFADQAEAMGLLFAASGGLIDAQDEATAAALGKASGPAPQLQSMAIAAALNAAPVTAMAALAPRYGTVDPEDVSGASFEQIHAGTAPLDPAPFASASATLTQASETLSSAADQLQSTLSGILGDAWQGATADASRASVAGFTASAHDLSTSLSAIATKADRLNNGFATTRSLMEFEAAGGMRGQGPGLEPDADLARRHVNTIYNPAVMDGNLADVDLPTAYRVVAGTALFEGGRLDLARAWNTDGHYGIAGPATAGATATGAQGGETVGASGAAAAGTGAGTVASGGATYASEQASAHDSATSATSGAGAAGPSATAGTAGATAASGSPTAGPAGAAHAAGPVNATTTPAAAPLLAGPATGAGATGATGGAAGAGRTGDRNERSRRALGAAAGGLGGASALGGAGTLAGYQGGTSGGPGSAGSGPGGSGGALRAPGGA
ncbi:MAG: WXG100 family type VII secretion target, partial [Brachybacterium sp.]|nr:WXG100 family type VII secretion target [Brachybacterium sp.]